MIVAPVVLIAGKLAVFTERRIVEIVAVAIDVIFGEVFVVGNLIVVAEFASLRPGLRLDFEELDIGRIICFANQKVAKLVKKEEFWRLVGVGIIKVIRWRKLKALAVFNLELGVIASDFFDEILHRDNNLELQRRSQSGP